MKQKDYKRLALLGLTAGLAVAALPLESEAGVTAHLAHQCGAGQCGGTDNTPRSSGQDAQGYYVKPGEQPVSQPRPQQDQKKQQNPNNN